MPTLASGKAIRASLWKCQQGRDAFARRRVAIVRVDSIGGFGAPPVETDASIALFPPSSRRGRGRARHMIRRARRRGRLAGIGELDKGGQLRPEEIPSEDGPFPRFAGSGSTTRPGRTATIRPLSRGHVIPRRDFAWRGGWTNHGRE